MNVKYKAQKYILTMKNGNNNFNFSHAGSLKRFLIHYELWLETTGREFNFLLVIQFFSGYCIAL